MGLFTELVANIFKCSPNWLPVHLINMYDQVHQLLVVIYTVLRLFAIQHTENGYQEIKNVCRSCKKTKQCQGNDSV